jgi:2-C-methyl-D-erythritol 4-phosphate cytidylyltransferase
MQAPYVGGAVRLVVAARRPQGPAAWFKTPRGARGYDLAMLVTAVVLGAGRGLRLGANDAKAHVQLAGRSLLEWSLLAMAAAKRVDAVLPVVGPNGESLVDEIRGRFSAAAELLPAVAGGRERQDSVAAGVAALPDDCEWVLVHDAARCLATPEEAEAVLEAARDTGAALLVTPVEDTIKRVDGDRVEATLDRESLARALTPQAFRLSVLRAALERAAAESFRGTDCASLVERCGVEVRTCAGSPENFKVTAPADLERAALVLDRRGA